MTKIERGKKAEAYKLMLTHQQLELIIKYCAITILDITAVDEYKVAAREIIEAALREVGDDFVSTAYARVKVDAVIQGDDMTSATDLAIIRNDSLSLRVAVNQNHDR